MCDHYVGYYRVSTERQGRSGLGLEAQQTAVEAFIASKGDDAKLVASYVEVESGKRSDNRPELTKAMEHARLTGSTLLIAKLDRLSRDAHFLLGLQKAGVRFVAADMPEANELVVGIMAVIAQAERKMISTRTKAALAEARKRIAVTGQRKHPEVKRLGCPTGAAHLRAFGNELGIQAIKAGANCAIEIQRAMVDRNAEVAPNKRIESRVVIHLGDVVEESDGDLMGDQIAAGSEVAQNCRRCAR